MKRLKISYLPVLAVLSIVFISGCTNLLNSYPELITVRAEPQSVIAGQDFKIFYRISNPTKLTFSPSIEFKYNNTCFQINSPSQLASFPPGENKELFTNAYVPDPYYFNNQVCEGGDYEIVVILKDITGTALDTEKLTVTIASSR